MIKYGENKRKLFNQCTLRLFTDNTHNVMPVSMAYGHSHYLQLTSFTV